MDRRASAVTAAIAEVRSIVAGGTVTREMLERIKSVAIGLAAQADLFPAEHFPIPVGKSTALFRLSEDLDRHFALYASANLPGTAPPPHNHTTWAVYSGVIGDERNLHFERIDDGGTPGSGRLRKTSDVALRRGNAIALMPEDFHTIEATGSAPALHLAFYGTSLEHLPKRIGFEGPEGGAYGVYGAKPEVAAPRVPARELKAMLRDGGELALLDVREEGVFSRSHLLFAVPLALSRLELSLAALVPRRSARIVLVDDGDGLADRAAALMNPAGYRNLAVLTGGVPAWKEAGFELFSGVNVPSKAFGEFIEHKAGTPNLSAAELKAKVDAGEKLVILDSRPIEEYRNMSIPGGIDCPGAELVRSVHDVAPSPDTLVVVNCAGRTRSIIGAQSLINAGIPNPVVALRNGTMGWHLAGLKIERGAGRLPPPPSPQGLAKARAAAERVAARAGVRVIDRTALARFEAERERRSLYLLDVRSPEEFLARHPKGARSAPGGQLVQATDTYVGTRNARLVLLDDDGVRALMTASWLLQMGWDEVYAMPGALSALELERGPAPREVLATRAVPAQTIEPKGLQALLAGGETLLLDFATSLQYRDGHIMGAWWAIRSRLAAGLPKLPAHKEIVTTSPDGALAALAAQDLAGLTAAPVRVLAGGTGAWRAAGLPLVPGTDRMADRAEDVWYRPYDRVQDTEAAMKEYLSWEVDLVRQIERDGDARFRILV